MGDKGLEVQRLYYEELRLNQPVMTRHVAHHRIAAAVTMLGLIIGTLGKTAADVTMAWATEFGEVVGVQFSVHRPHMDENQRCQRIKILVNENPQPAAKSSQKRRVRRR
ncbi:hypothetical protein [Bradyrhizobium sp. 23AC]